MHQTSSAEVDTGRRPSLLLRLLPMAAILLALAFSLAGAETKKVQPKPKKKPYVLKICVVSGLDLDDQAIVFPYEDREIKVCCDMCQDDFYKDPLHFVEKIEAAEKAKKPPAQKTAPAAPSPAPKKAAPGDGKRIPR